MTELGRGVGRRGGRGRGRGRGSAAGGGELPPRREGKGGVAGPIPARGPARGRRRAEAVRLVARRRLRPPPAAPRARVLPVRRSGVPPGPDREPPVSRVRGMSIRFGIPWEASWPAFFFGSERPRALSEKRGGGEREKREEKKKNKQIDCGSRWAFLRGWI